MKIIIINKTKSRIGDQRIKRGTAKVFRGLRAMGLTKNGDYRLHLVFLDKKESQKVNSVFRGQSRPTNVLSFNYGDFGEILLTPYIISKEAKDEGVSFVRRTMELIAHAALHLCGLDHETAAEAKKAERVEKELFGRVDIANF